MGAIIVIGFFILVAYLSTLFIYFIIKLINNKKEKQNETNNINTNSK